MPNPEMLESTLTNLAELQIQLNKEGGPEVNGLLFEQILGYQNIILKRFGLPIRPDYEKMVYFNVMPTLSELNERIAQLQLAATEYLLAHAKTDIQILREAQEAQSDPMYVLPEIKVSTHTYTIFVYNMILLKGKDSVENVLLDLRICNRPDILNALGQIQYGNIDIDREITEFLESAGVKYLNQFIIHNSDLLSDDDY